MALRNEDEGRAARAAVQIFVAAADREIGFRAVEIDRDGAAAMAEIPDDDRAPRMRLPRDRDHVVHEGRLVMHMREHDDAGLRIDGVEDVGRRGEAQIRAGEALQHVEVGRKIAGLGQDDRSVRHELAGGRRRP